MIDQIIKGSLEVLTSENTESCRLVSQHRCWTAEMFYSTDVGHERFWRVGIARNAVFFRSFVASKVRKGRSEKRGGAKDRLPKMSTKFAPRLRARAIRKSKSLKAGMPGALLEVARRKICTTPARESDSEVKIVKSWHVRSSFGS